MSNGGDWKSFWATIPGILKGLAALITAICGIWYVIPEPVINSFEAEPDNITIGDSARLMWSVSNARTISIVPGECPNYIDGNCYVSPIKTTNYTLKVKNWIKEKSKSVRIVVLPKPSEIIFKKPPNITDMRWDTELNVVEVLFDAFPAQWGDWTMYVDGDEWPMEGGEGNAIVRPNAPVINATGLFIGTAPWVASLTKVDFPCCGEIQFLIPSQGFTNKFQYNLIKIGCKTVSKKSCVEQHIEEFVTETPVDKATISNITDVRWDTELKVVEVLFDVFPAQWGDWTMYVDGDEWPMEGGEGNAIVRPNAPIINATGLFIGTAPWVTNLTRVDFPCCGEIQFLIPGQGFTNKFQYNLINQGCKTVSTEACGLASIDK